jgi:branched-chain amino acid transport system permease protein/urea transport system permease protein
MHQKTIQFLLGPVIWASLVLAPLVLSGWALTQLGLYMSYGILAMALAFIWGQAGIMSFGQAIFFGIGAYCMGLITLNRLPFLGDSTLMGLLLCLVLTFVVSLVMGRLLFHGRGLAGAYFAIVTLCAAVVVEALAQQWSFIGGFDGLLGIPPWVGFWRDDSDPYLSTTEVYFLMLGIGFLVFVALSFIIRSPVGTVLAAIRDNEERTAFFGYDIVRYKVGAFALSAVISGVAGALFVKQFGFAAPSLIGLGLSTEVLIWVAVGGRNVLLAAFLGALFVRSVEGVLSERLGYYWVLLLGLLFVATVVFMPSGIFGRILRPALPKRLQK